MPQIVDGQDAARPLFSRALHNRWVPLILDLDVADLAATRFAISPLSETITGLHRIPRTAGRQPALVAMGQGGTCSPPT